MRNCLSIILLAFFFTGNAQPYDFRHYQVENGLSNNAIICMLQDSKGFLWFGTKDGLNRFDGYSFKVFKNDPEEKGSLGNNFIHFLYEDPQGVLWVGTETGLFQYNAELERFSRIRTPVNGLVRDMIMDPQGDLWFIMDFNLYRYHRQKQERITLVQVGTNFEATSLCQLADRSLWVASSNGLLKHINPEKGQPQTIDVFAHSRKSVSNWIEKLYTTRDQKILIGTSNQGAKIVDPTTLQYRDILTYNADGTEIFARNFLQTSANEFWIATETGIYIYQKTDGSYLQLQKKYNDPYALSDNAVYSFCKDKEGGVWAGTYFGGVNYLPQQPLSFKKYFPMKGENALSGNVVREIHQDNEGNLWIGTEDAGLNKLDRKTGKFISFQPNIKQQGLSYSNIHGMLVEGNQLWIGTFEHGLDIMDIRSGKVIKHFAKGTGPHALKSNFIYALYKAPDGRILLCTTTGAYAFDATQQHFNPLPGLPVYNWYSSIRYDQNGNLWAGTYGNGLHYIENGTQKHLNFRYDPNNKNSLASDRINALFEDTQHQLWIATEGGLCKFEPKQKNFKRYTTQQGFPTNFILSIQEDRRHYLWISSTKGLVRFDPILETAQTFTKENGLLNDQFNFASAFTDQDGTMYFGTVKGFIAFQPERFYETNEADAVYITGLQINNQPAVIQGQHSPLQQSILFTKQIQLEHDQSTFSIDFAGMGYRSPERTNYAYRIEGLDPNWTFLKTNRKVYFTDLAPGKYVFSVKTVTANQNSVSPITTLYITILPPWWKSKWAYLLYTILAMLLTYGLAERYHNSIKEKNRRKIEQLSIKKEKELYEAKMDFFTHIAHEIKTPLTLIKGPLEQVIKKTAGSTDLKGSLSIMERNTNRLLELSHQLLDFRQTEIDAYMLQLSRANITEIMEEILFNFHPMAVAKNVQVQIRKPEAPVYAMIDVEAFKKILSNLFSNAIKYGDQKVMVELLLRTEGKEVFGLNVLSDGNKIPADMKDRIFEPFFRMKETEKNKGTGIGLALARSLTLLHKGSIALIETTDASNLFYLEIPLNQPL